ncbi:MAG: hypothetical protein IJM18_09600 [Clostridia bacterium]|nr:hypothetical protein [Clostridia bacterium]
MDSSYKAWSKFEKSGKLADYLCFCEERRRNDRAAKPADKTAKAEKAEDQSSL